jgi:hypothetical protein
VVYGRGVTKRRVPTAEDRTSAICIALGAIAAGTDFSDACWKLEDLHPEGNTFPGEVFIELAADAIAYAGATRQQRLDFDGIRERYLPGYVAHTRAQHHKSKYALGAAAMVAGGVDPGLLEEVSWWRTDDFWLWAFEALAIYVRAAADRRGQPVSVVCETLAGAAGVELPVNH